MTDGSPPDRRRLLRALGAGVLAATAGCQRPVLGGVGGNPPGTATNPPDDTPTGTGTPAEPPRADWFDRRLDAVGDLRLDSKGNRRIDEKLSDALEAGTLVVFPPGEYRLGGAIDVDADRIGLYGRGDARFRLPEGSYAPFVSVEPPKDGGNPPDRFMFAGIDIDMRGKRSGHMRIHVPTRFHVENVEYIGRGRHTGYAFNLAVLRRNGVGRLRNVRVRHGSRIDGYNAGNGRIGIWAGTHHEGTLRVESSDFREFGNNAMYTSRTPGNVQVVDSYFENNSPSSVRISGDGSFVENTTIRLDLARYTGPAIRDDFDARGVVIEQKKRAQAPVYPAGAEVRNCNFEYRDVGPGSPKAQSVIDVWGPARSLRVLDTTIRVDADGVPAIRREHPNSRGPFRPETERPPPPHWLRLKNVTITGSASGGAAVEIAGTAWSAMRETVIKQSGYHRDGVRLVDTVAFLLDGGQIRTSGAPMVVDPDGSNRSVCRVEFGREATLEQVVNQGLGIDQINATELSKLQNVTFVEPPTCGWPAKNGGISLTGEAVLKVLAIRDGIVYGVVV